eukprot:gb/GFBE01062318.1/.p1 GENE.gb/GFBE01062318.1/~~gb/GFBE01062318.1/.p1  ORF type:complete len:215 (+),score=32.32 gb/GFBE01062318.1/:1-645(+)
MSAAMVPVTDKYCLPGLRVMNRKEESGEVIQGFGDRLGDGEAVVRFTNRTERVQLTELVVRGSVREALERGTKEEAPLVIHRLQQELTGTRFASFGVSFVRAGVYKVGGHTVAMQWQNGLCIHGYFDERNALHPAKQQPLAFLEDHAPRAAAADEADLFAALSEDPSTRDKGAPRERSRSPRLPSGWRRMESRSKPGVYYFAHQDGRTQFERPT